MTLPGASTRVPGAPDDVGAVPGVRVPRDLATQCREPPSKHGDLATKSGSTTDMVPKSKI